jgi:hypothetical protein
MSGLGKELLVFDAAEANSSDNVGAYLRSSDGTLLTHTTVSGKEALDVNIANASVAISATDLDIRDLVFATDKVDVSGSEVSLDSATLAALESITVQNGAGAAAVNIQDGGNSITVDGSVTVSATDLDIRDLAFATDKVDVSGSEVSLDSATLAALENITVSATDLDIRDISHTQDSIKIGDGVDFLAVNADGSINVNADISVVNGHEKAEDAAHASGDVGSYVLAVRQDTLASSTSADGDYASLKVDSLGRLWTAAAVSGSVADDAVDSGNPIKVGTRALSGALAAVSATGDRADQISDLYRRLYINDSANIGSKSAAVTVGTSEIALSGTPLAGRRRMIIQNLSNKEIQVGPTGLSVASGLRIGAGGSLSLEIGPDVSLFAIAATAGNNVRVFELA